MHPVAVRLLSLMAASIVAAAGTGCQDGEGESDGAGGGDSCQGCDAGDQGGAPGQANARFGEEDPDDDSMSTGDSAGSTGGAGSGPPPLEGDCVGDELPTDAFLVRVDDSNAFASPLVVDALLEDWDGRSPLPARTHEYLNLFAPRVAEAEGPLAVDAGMERLQGAEREQVFALQVAVRHVRREAPAPRSIALLVDTSPSMVASVDRLLDAVDLVVEQLRPEDAVGVFSWSTDPARRTLRSVESLVNRPLDPAELRDAVTRAIDLAEPGDLGASLAEALAQARQGGAAEGTVLLVSDGSAGIDELTLSRVTDAAADPDVPVRVVGIGVGPARGYSDDILTAITDASGGASLYFDGTDGATALLADRFDEMLDVAERDVRLRLILPTTVRIVATSGGDAAEASDASTIEGQNLAAGGTMTFHEYLRWDGDPGAVGCEAVGWQVVRPGSSGDDEVLFSGTILLSEALGGTASTLGTVEGSAVVAAASALQGPTPARLASAIAAMHAVDSRLAAEQLPWGDGPLPQLCASLQRACLGVGASCEACPGVAAPEEGSP